MFAPKITPELLRSTRSNYTKKTPTRSLKIRTITRKSEPVALWVSPEMLTNGNAKLGEGVLSFDVPAVLTCPNCSDCRKGCYARKIEALRPTVFDKHVLNFLIFKYDFWLFIGLATKQILNSGKKIVRIHSSGDFFSQEYINAWVIIARQCKDVQFYTYTKTANIFDLSELDSLDNVNIVKSCLPDNSINFGNKEFLAEKSKKYPTIPICPVTQKVDGVHCMRECKHCLNCEYVLFGEH